MPMNFSGKEFLLKVLAELSTQQLDASELLKANDQLRAGLMLHGSTSDEAMIHYQKEVWRSTHDEDGNLLAQGLGLQDSDQRVSTLFFDLFYNNSAVKQAVMQHESGISADTFETLSFLIYQLLSACEMHPHLQSVENQGDIDVEYWTPKLSEN